MQHTHILSVKTDSHCSPDRPSTHYVVQADLKIMPIFLLCPSNCCYTVFVRLFHHSNSNKIETEIGTELVNWFCNSPDCVAFMLRLPLYGEWAFGTLV